MREPFRRRLGTPARLCVLALALSSVTALAASAESKRPPGAALIEAARRTTLAQFKGSVAIRGKECDFYRHPDAIQQGAVQAIQGMVKAGGRCQ